MPPFSFSPTAADLFIIIAIIDATFADALRFHIRRAMLSLI
jgi:hypothetical protein